MTRLKITRCAFFRGALVWCALGAVGCTQDAITLVYFNDAHELAAPKDTGLGGVARLFTVIDRVRTETPNTRVLFGGDFIGGTLLGDFRGAPTLEALNRLGIHWATFGRHEFDFGAETLRKRMREATFPFISSNVYDARTNRPFGGVPPYGLTVIGGVKLGVFAATGTLGDPTLSRDVRVEDVPAAARRAVKDLKKKGAEVIVGITQQNLHDDRELAKSVPGIDILFGEEESSTVSVVEWVGHTAIAKSAANLGSVVRVDVRADKSAPRFAVLPVDSQIPEDLRLAALTSRVMGELAKHWTEVVGRVDVPLDARAESNRLGETALGDLIADAFRSYYDADVGLLNGGAIRSDQVIPRGRVTLRQIHELLPYRDRVVLLLVEGRDLKAAIEDGLRRYGASEGAFPHVSGLSYRFDPRKPAGGRIVEITANGVPLSDVSPLRVATRAYLAAGGDGYRALRRGKVAVAPALSPSETDVFAAYLRKNHPIAGVSARRIQNATDGDATNASAP